MAPNTIGREQPVRKRLVAKKPAKCDSDSSELYEPKVKSKRESSTSNKSSVWSSIGWMTIGCVIGCILITSVPTPQFVRQLAQLKRQLMPGPAKIIVPLTSAPLQDTRPATQQPGQQEVGENGEMYEYHQFMAAVEQHFDNVSLHQVECRYDGYQREMSRNAAPERCGTLIFDDMINRESMEKLRDMARRYCTVLGDTNFQNRESYNLRWINLHHLFKYGPQEDMFNEQDYDLIRNTSEAVKHTVCSTFGLPPERTFFSPVSQFTRYKPTVPYQEFRHVDKVRSPYLIVTTILWLSTVDVDFTGGRTEFLTGGPEPFTPLLIEPKFGRFAAWTSGWENPHGVMEVESGERLALIFAFTVHDDIGYKSMDTLREWAMTEVPDRTPEQQKYHQEQKQQATSGGGGY